MTTVTRTLLLTTIPKGVKTKIINKKLKKYYNNYWNSTPFSLKFTLNYIQKNIKKCCNYQWFASFCFFFRKMPIPFPHQYFIKIFSSGYVLMKDFINEVKSSTIRKTINIFLDFGSSCDALVSLSVLSFLSSEGNNKRQREKRASSRLSLRKCRQKLAGTLRCKFVRQRRVNWGRLRLRRDNTVFLQMSLWAVLTLHYGTWIRLVSKYGLERQPAFVTNEARISSVILSWGEHFVFQTIVSRR